MSAGKLRQCHQERTDQQARNAEDIGAYYRGLPSWWSDKYLSI